jgi:hypothetical protein
MDISGQDCAALPRWARVAFAARNARRVQPVFRLVKGVVLEEHFRSIEEAITFSEQAAATGRPPNDNLSSIVQRVSAAIEAVGGVRPATGTITPAQCACAAAMAAKCAVELIENWNPNRASATFNFGVASSGFATGQIQLPVLIALYKDFLFLKQAAANEKWDDDTLVSKEIFGPFWPDGLPEGWSSFGIL